MCVVCEVFGVRKLELSSTDNATFKRDLVRRGHDCDSIKPASLFYYRVIGSSIVSYSLCNV